LTHGDAKPTRYSIVGLGKLGASMAAAIASRGFDVIGVDINAPAIEAVNAGRAPVDETGLASAVEANRARLSATACHAEAVVRSDVTFVVVPTPSDSTGMFSLRYARYAFREIGHGLAEKQNYHLVVLTSTVMPGSTRQVLIPELEGASGKRCGRDFGVCYSPEFIALGTVIRDFLNPDFTLVGEFDEQSGAILECCYARIVKNGAPCKRMSLENAELTKLAVNTFVTTKIAYANMLSELCEAIPGGDVDVVSDALGADKRIGRRYLAGGLGFGGPCFPRDNVALSAFGRRVGAATDIALATDAANRVPVRRLVEYVRAAARPGGTVAVLGLAYKPQSHVIERSQGLEAALAIADSGLRVVCYDPLAHAARNELKDKAVVLDSAIACLGQADIVVIANPDPEFARLTPEDFPLRSPPVQVIDCWRLLRPQLEGSAHVRYRAVGVAGHVGDAFARLWERLSGTEIEQDGQGHWRRNPVSGRADPEHWVFPAGPGTQRAAVARPKPQTHPPALPPG
jgi:UDPglucose 6-dehydrogenase